MIAEPSRGRDRPSLQNLGTTLREIRESFHRRARFASANEAVDEVGKLLFAHILALQSGQEGITYRQIVEGHPEHAASRLAEFVNSRLVSHLPRAVDSVHADGFRLRIGAAENELARDIVRSFQALAEDHALGSDINTDLFNEVFGRFLADSFHDEKEFGQYLTPPEIVSFMVQLAVEGMSQRDLAQLTSHGGARDFGIILDPSCGVGSFLVQVVRALETRLSDTKTRPESIKKWRSELGEEGLVGIDKSERMVRLAMANLASAGVTSAQLHLANGLSRHGSDGQLSESLEGRVGLILTNPPFGAEFGGSDIEQYRIATSWSTKTPRKLDSEMLFLERYVDWLRPGGQALAIVPDSILTNKNSYLSLRQGLSDLITIESVVSLPTVTFAAAGTSTKTSILHLRKREAKRPSSVAFTAICRNVGYTVSTRGSQRNRVPTGECDLPLILQAASGGPTSSVRARPVRDLELAARWDATYHASLPSDIAARLEAATDADVWVSEVAELSGERCDPRRSTGTFDYIEISDVNGETLAVNAKQVDSSSAPSRARKVVRPGDVLVSTVRPERRTVGVVRDDQDGFVCSTGFAVLRPTAIDPSVLGHLLRTDFVVEQIMRNNVGIAYPAVEESCLLELLLPIRRSRLNELTHLARDVRLKELRAAAVRSEFGRELSEAVTDWIVDPSA